LGSEKKDLQIGVSGPRSLGNPSLEHERIVKNKRPAESDADRASNLFLQLVLRTMAFRKPPNTHRSHI